MIAAVADHLPIRLTPVIAKIVPALSFLIMLAAAAQLYMQSAVGDAIGWFLFVLAVIMIIGLIFLIFAIGRWYMKRKNGNGLSIYSDEILIAQIQKLNAQLDEMKANHQREIDALIARHQSEMQTVESERLKLERRLQDNVILRRRLLSTREEEESRVTRLNQMTPLLVIIGNDAALQIDEAALRAMQGKTGRSFRRVRNATLELLKEHLERGRINKRPYKHIHLAVHSQPEGIYLGGELVSGLQLSEALKGVEILLIAGCESAAVGDRLGGIKWVITMTENAPNEDAAWFAQAFWTEIGLGHHPPEALQLALEASPSGMDEYIEFHW